MFRLETKFLDYKQDFKIRKKSFRLETQFLDWKHNVYIGNKICRF